jgi:hypothetical protein
MELVDVLVSAVRIERIEIFMNECWREEEEMKFLHIYKRLCKEIFCSFSEKEIIK